MSDEESVIKEVADYDWSDITPIPQDDGPNPAAKIAYAPQCTLMLISLFRMSID